MTELRTTLRRTPIQHSLDIRCGTCGDCWEIQIDTDESLILLDAIVTAHLTERPGHKITSSEIRRVEHQMIKSLVLSKMIMEDSA